MKALAYVLRKQLKNTLLDMVRHPAKLIAYGAILALLVFSGAVNMANPPQMGEAADLRLLEGAYLGLLLMMALPSLFMGMRSGANLFTMADVNLLFVSPLSPRSILAYSLVKQMGTTLLVTVLMLSYGGMAVNFFGIQPWMAVLLLFGFAAAVFLVQLLTMVIYSFTNGNPQRVRGVKAGLIAVLAVVAALVGLPLYFQGFSAETAYGAISQPALEWLPFLGWIKGMLFAVMEGDWRMSLVFAALLVLGTGAAILLFMRMDADYYEDVLRNAETTYEIKAAAKEGRTSGVTMNTRTPKVRDTGIGRGWGASVFFYKHLRERKRRSRLIFVGGGTLGMLAGGLFFGLILSRAGGEDPMSPNLALMTVLIMCLYFLLFSNSAGEWGQELSKPYIYLVPASPMKKLLWGSLTSLIKPVVDGVLVFTVVGITLGAGAFTIAMSVLVYISFGALFTGANILSQRLFGVMANQGLLLILYMLVLFLLTLPGIAAGITVGVLLPGLPKAIMALPLSAWNLLAALGIYALSRGALHDMEV